MLSGLWAQVGGENGHLEKQILLHFLQGLRLLTLFEGLVDVLVVAISVFIQPVDLVPQLLPDFLLEVLNSLKVLPVDVLWFPVAVLDKLPELPSDPYGRIIAGSLTGPFRKPELSGSCFGLNWVGKIQVRNWQFEIVMAWRSLGSVFTEYGQIGVQARVVGLESQHLFLEGAVKSSWWHWEIKNTLWYSQPSVGVNWASFPEFCWPGSSLAWIPKSDPKDL